MHVEHWVPRSGYPDSDEAARERCGARSLDWRNLLGVCGGVSRGMDGLNQEHCDRARGNKRLHLHPCETPDLAARFRYNRASGEMRPAQPHDAQAAADIETLNLNAPRIMANRARVVRTLQTKLRADDSPRTLRALWRLATDAPSLAPYAPVAAQYLEPRMRRRGLL